MLSSVVATRFDVMLRAEPAFLGTLDRRRLTSGIIEASLNMSDRSHYRKPCPYNEIDVYRVLVLFDVKDPCIQHAIKKLLAAGKRGDKCEGQDVQEAIEALERWHDMRTEESFAGEPCPTVKWRQK
jgi:hypothetical protein